MATKADIQAIFARIEGLSSQYSALSKPNYSLMVSIVGVGMVFLTMIGGFAYWPINSATTDLKQGLNSIMERIVTQKQYDADQKRDAGAFSQLRSDVNISIQQQRYNADMGRIYGELSLLREKAITRVEFDTQHRDLQSNISSARTERKAQLGEISRRVERLESLSLKSGPAPL